jgi:hypothetical protein
MGPVAALGKQAADPITPQALREFNQEGTCCPLELGRRTWSPGILPAI